MLLFEIRSTGVARDGEGVEVSSILCKLPESIAGCLKILINGFDFQLVDAVYFESNLALKHVAEGDVGLLDANAAIEALSKLIRETCEDSVRRHADAFARQEAMIRNHVDPHIIRLNQLVWHAQQVGAELWILPRTCYQWRFVPTDPAILRCAVPIEVIDSRIDNAEVLGVREVLQRQRELWNPAELIDVIISLNHRIAEVRHCMTRDRAQALWSGSTRISAEVRRRGAEIPAVIGEMATICDPTPNGVES